MVLSSRRLALVSAFGAVYLVWGSTYLGIRVGLEGGMPPFLMAGTRWLLAGALLYAWRRARGHAPPTPRQWGAAALVGLLLIVGGNGTVSWAQQWVPSGLTALLVAIVPLWIALLGWLRPGGARPTARVWAGIVLGLAGVGLLVAPAARAGLADAEALPALLGSLAILLAAFSWANGSLYSRRAPLPPDGLLNAGAQMLAGGAALTLLGLAAGESARVDLAAVPPRAWAAYAFLVLFGSIVAYSAYLWLLQATRPQLVATYAFVNPVVAVVLGALLAGEVVSLPTALAAALIVLAVAITVTAPRVAAPVEGDKAKPAEAAAAARGEGVRD